MPAKRRGGTSSVRAVDRAIAILQCFTAEQPAMTVIDIQMRLGLNRPTLYRLLHALSIRGLIHAEGDPQRFRLSHGVIKLSNVWLEGLEVVELARPILEELREVTGETAALFKLDEDRGICVLECESRHALSVKQGVGASLKIAQGATGEAMLAFMPAERQTELLTSLSGDGRRANLEEALRAVAQNGFSISRDEIPAGAAVVTAYFDHRGSVAGSVGLYGPSARVTEEKVLELARLVRVAGHNISTLLGYRLPEVPDVEDCSRAKGQS